MDETAVKKASLVQHKEEEACGKKQEQEAQEQDTHEKVERAKNAKDQEEVIANEVSLDQSNQALIKGRSDDCTIARANMDAHRLVELIYTSSTHTVQFKVSCCFLPCSKCGSSSNGQTALD